MQTTSDYNLATTTALAFLSAVMMLSACGPRTSTAADPGYQATPNSGTAKCNSSPSLKEDSDEPITFYKDVLPILDASTTGRVYKCTVCHSFYSKPSGSNSVDKIERIIDSVESGRMPLEGGDRVSPGEIQVLKLWRATGFQEGDPSDFESDIKLTPDSNSNCNSNQQ